MKIQSINQVRARNALATAEKVKSGSLQIGGRDQGQNTTKKIAQQIINHGLLATAADAKGNPGAENIFGEIARHLSNCDIKLMPKGSDSLSSLLNFYTRPKSNSRELKLATAETMAWLDYARRFL